MIHWFYWWNVVKSRCLRSHSYSIYVISYIQMLFIERVLFRTSVGDNASQLESSKEKLLTTTSQSQEKTSQITNDDEIAQFKHSSDVSEASHITSSVSPRSIGMSAKKNPLSTSTSSFVDASSGSASTTGALSSASSNNADISSDEDFQDSPGELFIDEGLEESPRKTASTVSSTTQQMINSSLNLKSRKSPVFTEHKTDIASKFDSSAIHGRPSGVQQSPGFSSGNVDRKGSPAHSTGDRSYSRQSSIMSEKSSTSDQMSNQSAIEEENSKLVGSHFPNIITADGELLKKRKKRDKNKTKTSNKDLREKDTQQQSLESKSSTNIIKEKMHKKKRKHDSRSNSEEPPSVPPSSHVHSSISSSKRLENLSSEGNIEKPGFVDLGNSSQKNVSFKKTLPLKPLKVDTKVMKCSSGKNRTDDDKLFKPDPVIKSPKLSPKSLEKTKIRTNPGMSSSGYSHTQLVDRSNASSTFTSSGHQSSKVAFERNLMVETVKEPVKENVDSQKYSDNADAEHDLSTYANKKKRLIDFREHPSQQTPTSLSQNFATSCISSAPDAPNCKVPDASLTSIPVSRSMFHNSPVVRLTVEPTIEARTADQNSAHVLIQPNFERGSEVVNETMPQRVSPGSTDLRNSKYDDSNVHKDLKTKAWQMETSATRETSADYYKTSGDENQLAQNLDRLSHREILHEKAKSDQREKLPKILIGDKLSRSLNDSFSIDEEGDSFEDGDIGSNDEFDEEVAESTSQSEMENKDSKMYQETTCFVQQSLSSSSEDKSLAMSSCKLIKTEAGIKIEGTFGISAEKFIPVTKPTPNYQSQIKTCEKEKMEKLEENIGIVKVEIKEEVEDKITENHSDGTQEQPIDTKTMSCSGSGGTSVAVAAYARVSSSKEQQAVRESSENRDYTMKAEVCDNNLGTDIVTSMDNVGHGNNPANNQMDVDVTFLQESAAGNDEIDTNLEDGMGSNAGASSAAGDNASLRGGLGRRRKRPLKFSDGNDSPIDYVLMNERGRPPKRGGANNQRKEVSSDNSSNVDSSNAKQTRRKGRWANNNSDNTGAQDSVTSRRGTGDEATEYIGKTRTATRNSAKNAAFNSTNKSDRKTTERNTNNSSQQSQAQSNVDQPPIILKINTSQFRTSSPTMGSQAENEGSGEAEQTTERSATPVRNESSQDSNASEKISTLDTNSGKSKTERTARITRTLRLVISTSNSLLNRK